MLRESNEVIRSRKEGNKMERIFFFIKRYFRKLRRLEKRRESETGGKEKKNPGNMSLPEIE